MLQLALLNQKTHVYSLLRKAGTLRPAFCELLLPGRDGSALISAPPESMLGSSQCNKKQAAQNPLLVEFAQVRHVGRVAVRTLKPS